MERTPMPGEFYRHFKGMLCQIVTVAEHTESGEKLVIYQTLGSDYRIFARPLSMFFDKVDHEKYPEAGQIYRFERVEPPRAGSQTAGPYGNKLSGDGSFKDELHGAEEIDAGSGLHPLILEFAEAEDYDRKLAVFASMRRTLTQADLDVLCDMLDLPEKGGDIKTQADAIESYLKMCQKFNGTRLR